MPIRGYIIEKYNAMTNGISVGHGIIFFYDIASDRHKTTRDFSILMVNIAKSCHNSKKYSSYLEKGAIYCVS